jgi:N-acyl-D-aspartate/D-glutamate deacylase
MMEKLDLLITNARLIDGAGNPSYKAQIGIVDGKIACIRRDIRGSSAVRTIDAEGLTVCPGFIDTHSHDDAYLLLSPKGDQKVCQGVTTDVTGNCGFSLAPISDKHRNDLRNASAMMGGSFLSEEF